MSNGLAAVVLLALVVVGLSATSARAIVLGSQDAPTAGPEQLAETRALGALTSRVLIDPSRPLSSYDDAIERRGRAAMTTQLVIGGLYAGPLPSPAQAVEIFQRWPDAYSVSIGNEPELAGMMRKPCEFRRAFVAIYAALKRAGARRVLFGEWSPHSTATLTTRILKCGPITADGFAWHAYDWDARYEGRITNLPWIRTYLEVVKRRLHTSLRTALPMYVTEYAQLTRGPRAVDPQTAAARWQRAIGLARRYGVMQLVAYGVHEAPESSTWDSSIIDASGSPLPAVSVIRSFHRRGFPIV